MTITLGVTSVLAPNIGRVNALTHRRLDAGDHIIYTVWLVLPVFHSQHKIRLFGSLGDFDVSWRKNSVFAWSFSLREVTILQARIDYGTISLLPL